MATKQELLDQIKADIIKDNACPDLAQNANNLVFGAGNPNAEIMLIGEAPGKKEDEQGEPFVGAAGKFLNEMLTANRLNRDQVYITNIVKYRPPNNRDPEPEEKLEFWPYLVRQINAIVPKVVVTLGRHPMVMFLPNQKISQIHGQPKRIKWNYGHSKDLIGGQAADGVPGSNQKRTNRADGTSEPSKQIIQLPASSKDIVESSAVEQGDATLVILPLYHPAAALYNGAMRETLKEDFNNIMTTINLIRSKRN